MNLPVEVHVEEVHAALPDCTLIVEQEWEDAEGVQLCVVGADRPPVLHVRISVVPPNKA